MRTMRANVSDSGENVGRKLMFNREIPIVDDRWLIIGGRIPTQIQAARSKSGIRGRRERSRKQIRLGRAVLRGLGRGKSAKRIGQSSRIDDAGAKNELRTERSLVHKPVVDDSGDSRIVKDTGTAAQTGLSVAEYIVRKANPGSEILEAGIQAILGHTGVSGKVDPWGRIGELRGPDVREEAVHAELLNASFDFPPGQNGLVADSQI